MTKDIDAEVGIQVDIKEALEQTRQFANQIADVAFQVSGINEEFKKVGVTIGKIAAGSKQGQVKALLGTIGTAGSTVDAKVIKAAQAAQKEQFDTSAQGRYISASKELQRIESARAGVAQQYLKSQGALLRGEEQFISLKKEQAVLEQKIFETLTRQKNQYTDANLAKYSQRVKEIQSALQDFTPSGQKKAVPLTREQRIAQQRQDTQDRLFSDGGAALLAIQNRLLINYKLLSAAYSSVGFIKNFITEIDDALAQLQSITGSTNTQMITLKNTILEVAQSSRFSTTEIAKAATTLAQAGFSSDQIKAALKSIVDLAQATGSTLTDSVNLATTVLSVFNIQAERTGFVADVITNALNQSKASVENLSLGLQYSANIAADANIGFVDLTAALATLTNQGIKSGSTIGTGTRQLITDLQNPSEKLIKRLGELGLSTQDIDLKIKGLSGVLKTLSEAGFTTSDALATMELRAASIFSALQRGSGQFENFQTSLLISGAAAEASSKRMESLSSKVANFQNVFGEAAEKGLKPLLEGLKFIIDKATDLFRLLNEFPNLLKGVTIGFTLLAGAVISVQIVTLISNLKGFTLVIGALGTVITSFVAVIRGAVLALQAFGFAVSGLAVLTGVGAIIAVAAGAFLLLGSNAESAADKLEKAKTASAEAASETDKHSSRIKQLTDFIDSLDKKQTQLTQGSAALNAEIINAQIQFGGLSGKVDLAATSYDGLRSSLVELLKVEKERKRYALVGENAATKQEISLLEEQIQSTDYGSRLKTASRDGVIQRNIFTQGATAIGDNGNKIPLSPQAVQAFKGLEDALKDKSASQATINDAIGKLNDLIAPGGELAGQKKIAESINSRILVASEAMSQLGQLESKRIQEKDQSTQIAAAAFFRSSEAEDFKSQLDKFSVAIDKNLSDAKDPTKSNAEKLNSLKLARDLAKEAQQKFGPQGTEVPVQIRNSEDVANLFSEKVGKKMDGAITEIGVRTDINQEDTKTTIESLTAKIGEEKAKLSNASVADQKVILSGLKDLIEQRRVEQLAAAKTEITDKVRKEAASLPVEEQNQIITKRLDIAKEKIDADAAAVIEKSSGAVRTVGAKFTDEIRSFVDQIIDSIKQAKLEFARIQNENKNNTLKVSAEIDAFNLRKNRGKLTPGEEVALKDKLEAAQLLEQRNNLQASIDLLQKLQTKQDELLKGANISKEKFSQYQQQGFEDKPTATFAGSAIGTQKANYNKAVKAALENQKEIDATTESIKANTIAVEANDKQRETSLSLTENLKQAWSAFTDTIQGSNDQLTQLAFIDTFKAIQSSFTDMFTSFVTGTKSASQAFKDFAISIIKSMAEIAAKRAAAGLLDLAMGQLGSLFGGLFGGSGSATIGSGDPGADLLGNAAGGYITGGIPGKDSVIAKVMPGEYIAKKSTVDALGPKFFSDLDTQGKKALNNYGSTTVVNQGGGSKQVNVYVVSPDNVPPMGPDDVIATVGDNIQRGGPLKKLIKSVMV